MSKRVLYQNTITNLRHHWEHPSFPDFPAFPEEAEKVPSDKDKSIAWLRDYAKRLKPYDAEEGKDCYAIMMDEIRFDGYVCSRGNEDARDVRYDDEFFRHLSIVLGRNVDPDSLTYTCGC